MSNRDFVHFPVPFKDGARRLSRPTEPHQTEAVNALKMCDAMMPHTPVNKCVSLKEGSDATYAETNESPATGPAAINQGRCTVGEGKFTVSIIT